MDIAMRRNSIWLRWTLGAVLALLPFTGMAQSSPPAQVPATGEAASQVSAAANEGECRACGYERVGRKIDIALVVLIAVSLVSVLVALSREWGTTSQRWTCRSLALFMLAVGAVLLWRTGSVLYLGYNPWQEDAAAVDAGWATALLSTSPKWLMAVLLIGSAPTLWKRSERLPRWRIS